MDGRRWRSWRVAMHDALYGADGFYRRTGAPAAHFRTAAHTSPAWAAAVAELARRVDVGLDEPANFTVVDIGSGGGELLDRLAAAAPERWSLVGVDVAARPAPLAERVQWVAEPPPDVTGLLLANEWLDVIPLDVVELTDAGPRVVEVSDDGSERLGPPPHVDDLAWMERWWPLVDVGDRGEVGRPRDEAWSDVVTTLTRGLAVAVDYVADPARDVAGTMTGYRGGRQIVPVPDGSCDITAHVVMQACAAAVADIDATLLTTQRDALRALGVSGERPSYDGDPQRYVAALSQASAAAELLDPYGLGAFAWLLHMRDCPPPW